LAFLNQGITIILKDERTSKEEIFFYKGGIVEYIKYLTGAKEKVNDRVIYLNTKRDTIEIEIAFQYVNSYTENILSFVNNINTAEGGTHLTGFKGALTRTINNFAQSNNLLKKDFKANFSGDDVREGLIAIISLRLKNPQFEGQTKSKLGNSEVKGLVESFVNEKLLEYFEEHINIARSIINKACIAAQAREASRKAKDLVRKSSLLENTTLPGKLADCQSKNPEDSELYIVEGDSAGGSAKQGRDRRYQAILPLKGKILNVEKASTHKMLENTEIKTMIAAFGVGIGKDNFDVEKLRYHKVIIMTDADVDGAHIRTLFMTFLFRHMRPIIEKGYLYLAQPPLYLVRKGRSRKYLKNEKELENYLLKIIGDEVVVFLNGNEEQGLKNAKLVKLVKLINKKNILIENIAKRGMPRVITQKLIELIKDEASFKDRDKAEEIAEKIRKSGYCKSVLINFDEEYSTYILEIEYELNGVVLKQSIDWDYLTGPLFAEVNKAYEQLKNYPKAPYNFKIGNNEYKIDDEKEFVSFLFEKIKKGLYIQRYKGLGEMNPSQLWETTMDPENRTLLKVQINDFFESEVIFDILMGNDSSKRKDFIFENALKVRNLDI